MKTRKIVAAVAVAACSAALVSATAVPAAAATASGVADNWIGQCDASVYVSDDLIGSAGKIEAWGGYVCPTGYHFIGQLRITLRKGKTTAKTYGKNVQGDSHHVDVTVPNAAGNQDWHADLWLFRPGMSDAIVVSTGVVRS
jgi:hypothetical protein